MLSSAVTQYVSAFDQEDWSLEKRGNGRDGTFEELAAIYLAGSNLESNDMTLLRALLAMFSSRSPRQELCCEKAGCWNIGHTCASFSSLIGMPIVLVMVLWDN
jgi:hypothetical protein